jgi:hypothetical protein
VIGRSRAARLRVGPLLVGCVAGALFGCSTGSNYTCCRHGRAPSVVEVSLGTPYRPTAARLRVGQILDVEVVNPQEVSVVPSGVLHQLNPGPGVEEFRAVRPGRATIRILRSARCTAPTGQCSRAGLASGLVLVAVS